MSNIDWERIFTFNIAGRYADPKFEFKDTLSAIEFLLLRRKRQEVMVGLEPIGFSEKDFN